MSAPAQRDIFPIERLEHPVSGDVRYVPLNQTFFDDEKTLERDGLIHIERNEDGQRTALFVLAPMDPRVLCWKLSANAAARRRGAGDVWKDLPVDVYTEISDSAH